MDCEGFDVGAFIVLLVLPGDRPMMVNLFSDVEIEGRRRGSKATALFPSMPLWPGIHIKGMFALERVVRRMKMHWTSGGWMKH